MISKETIAINKITEVHLKAICELLGIVFTGFDNFGDVIQVYFDDEKIEDKDKCLSIKNTGEIYIFFDSLLKDNEAVNAIPVVYYLIKNNLLLEDAF
jgi:hypothetical protein